MSPDLKETLRDAAREPQRSVDVDAIHRRGRRGRATEIVASVAALALVAGGVAYGLDRFDDGGRQAPVLSDGGPTDDRPSERDAGAQVPTLTAAQLGADVLIAVDAAEGDGHVRVRHPDGSVARLPIETAQPSVVEMVADGQGGFSWQPRAGAGGSPPILHVAADGSVSTVVDATTDTSETYRLLGGNGFALLVERRTGTGFEDTRVDLLTVWAGGTGVEPELVAADLASWEGGLISADRLEIAIYAAIEAGSAPVVVVPPDAAPVTVWTGGEEAGGTYPVDVAAAGGNSYVLVEDSDGSASLLVVRMGDPARVRTSWKVPLDLGGVEGAEAYDLATHGNFVLVNRRVGERFEAAVVYETTSGRWYELDVAGRALLAAPSTGPEPPPACVDDDEFLDAAPPVDDQLFLYLSCPGGADWEPWRVYLTRVGEPRSGDTVTDARRILELMLAGPSEELEERGYAAAAAPGAAIRDVRFDGSTLVVDFDFSGVTSWVIGTSAGGAMWHAQLIANLLQFPEVETLELHEGGSCERYPGFFESDGCFRFTAAEDAAWNQQRPFD